MKLDQAYIDELLSPQKPDTGIPEVDAVLKEANDFEISLIAKGEECLFFASMFNLYEAGYRLSDNPAAERLVSAVNFFIRNTQDISPERGEELAKVALGLVRRLVRAVQAHNAKREDPTLVDLRKMLTNSPDEQVVVVRGDSFESLQIIVEQVVGGKDLAEAARENGAEIVIDSGKPSTLH